VAAELAKTHGFWRDGALLPPQGFRKLLKWLDLYFWPEAC
jgi:hypothetical protein